MSSSSSTNLSFNFCISCELFRNVLEALSSISISAHLFFDSSKGLYGSVLDQHERFLAQFVVSRQCFEFDENADSFDNAIDIPLYFEGVIDFITYLQKGYALKMWPLLRCIQGMHFENCQATKKFTYAIAEDVVNIPTYTSKLFPAVNLHNYPYTAILSKAEFSHQIELALVNNKNVHIGICNRFLLLYTEGNGRDQKVIPTVRVTADHPLLSHGFNEKSTSRNENHDPNDDDDEDEKDESSKVSKELTLKFENLPEEKCLVQQHSLRYLSVCCKTRQNCDSVVIGMSKRHGLIVLFPIRGYGLSKLNKQNVLVEESYFRYRMLPDVNSKVPFLEPFPESMEILRSKLVLDQFLKEKAQRVESSTTLPTEILRECSDDMILNTQLESNTTKELRPTE
jgi:hypothetical protein